MTKNQAYCCVMIRIIEESNGKVVAVPANMTHIFQPLDLTVNRASKAFLRKLSQDWYSNEIRKQMEQGTHPHKIKVDVGISILKPLHAKCKINLTLF